MEKTPLSLRTRVSIFGNTNSGKSTLFNALLGQELAIVSPVGGTTTDPVTKAMELLPYGPIALTDTAGLDDTTQIGAKRIEKTDRMLDAADFAIYAASCDDFDRRSYELQKKKFAERGIGHLLVLTKADLAQAPADCLGAVIVSAEDRGSIEGLKKILAKRLSALSTEETTMIGDLLPEGSTVVMVVPIDSEAPKGRLILPQVQFLRDCLDHGIKAVVTRDTELEETVRELNRIDLVVTDSQAFAYVSETVPEDIMLTSFSMLMAKTKGGIGDLIKGAYAIDTLRDKSRILMAEACTHNASHEDIGRVKIPAMLKKYTGKNIRFDYCVHGDFPENLSCYDLVIHCGGCMINSRLMKNRLMLCKREGVPVTNYGMVIAHVHGILERSGKIFKGMQTPR